MASEKKTKTDAPPKAEPAVKAEKAAPIKSEAKEAVKEPAKEASKEATATEAAGPETAKADAPTRYSRGEGQKAVTQAYKDNWNDIFGKKPNAKPRKPKAAKAKAAKPKTAKPKTAKAKAAKKKPAAKKKKR